MSKKNILNAYFYQETYDCVFYRNNNAWED